MIYKIWAEATSVNEVKALICLPDIISNKSNVLTIYFTAAKLLGKGLKTNTCIFTTLWAIFLETLLAQGIR